MTARTPDEQHAAPERNAAPKVTTGDELFGSGVNRTSEGSDGEVDEPEGKRPGNRDKQKKKKG
ncbi:hypothetical protein [Actinocorallia longicatena]|uniref:Uncharacterized protein n=1 Tax=Actinocorallia longicatena TaxID=111803 RepID=A0ABP6QC21_9ACTN